MQQLQDQNRIYVGTAGWNLLTPTKERFQKDGSHLSRYAQAFNAVEINSSFYRDHLPETYRKWASMVPEHFRFSVKLSKYFTQESLLHDTGDRLTRVLSGISQLGAKWGVLLVQLPPSLVFDPRVSRKFFGSVRKQYDGPIAFEPRHRSWIQSEGLALLHEFQVSKVIADPDPCLLDEAQSVGSGTLLYYRLHGSPEIYRSKYEPELIQSVGKFMSSAAAQSIPAWCIFDNTTFGYATDNAMELQSLTTPPV